MKNAVRVARRHGFALEMQPSPGGRDLGVLAKLDVVSLERGNASVLASKTGFHHGVLHCIVQQSTQKVHILATHLSPHSAARRRLEARSLIAVVQKLEAEDDKAAVVVAGDLNTLSPLDRDQHGPELLAMLRTNPRLQAKFLVTPDPDADIDYMPMRILLTDLVDVAFSHAQSDEKPHPTVPTERHADKLHAAPMRIDYVLLNAQAAATLLDMDGRAIHVHAQIDDFTKQASDHYPLVVDLPKSTNLNSTASHPHHSALRKHHLYLYDQEPEAEKPNPDDIRHQTRHLSNDTPNTFDQYDFFQRKKFKLASSHSSPRSQQPRRILHQDSQHKLSSLDHEHVDHNLRMVSVLNITSALSVHFSSSISNKRKQIVRN